MMSNDFEIYSYQVRETTMKRPFFGKTQEMLDKIQSLDEKWYVEFWTVRYYFMGIELYSYKKEVLKYPNGKIGSSKKNA